VTSPGAAGGQRGFGKLLGDGRGPTDPRLLQSGLIRAERELGLSQTRANALATELDAERAEVVALTEHLQIGQVELRGAHSRIAHIRHALDTARYAAMRAGAPDPVASNEQTYQGPWTSGRVFLADQHSSHPLTGTCYRAQPGGVAAGLVPGSAIGWEHCVATCRPLKPIPVNPHPVQSGHALRQDQHWWDASGTRWAISDLTPEHLTAVIDWLREHIETMWQAEQACVPARLPCPSNAYASAQHWLADTPLMRALLAEATRREQMAPPAARP
jgi:hypothetical protein